MTWTTTTYRLETPQWLWSLYTETVPGNRRYNDPLVECVAERILEEHDQLDPETERRVKALLEADDGV